MNARHHPADDVLWDYHRGALAPGLGLAVRGHLQLCPHCRSDMRLLDAVGGALLDRVEGMALADDALDIALARIERPSPPAKAPRRLPAFLDGLALPRALKAARIHGRRWVAPGVWLARVEVPDARGTAPTYLLRVPAGMAVPVHTHRGREATLVLKGRFYEDGITYGIGDFVGRDGGDVHAPMVTADGDCICLIAQEAPIVPLDWLGRVLQTIGGF